MTVATFGELLHSANAHIDAAARFPDVSLTAGSVTAATRQACRVVTAMSHYLDDAVPRSEYGRAVRSGMEPWMRAAVDTRGALKMAAENLSRGAGDAGGLRGPCATAADPLAAHLAGAAGALAAGRDLLDTHFVISADRTRSAHSDWSAVVASAPVARALLGEIAGWSSQLAILAGRLTLAAAADPAVGMPLRERAGQCSPLAAGGGCGCAGRVAGPPGPCTGRRPAARHPGRCHPSASCA